MKTILLFAVVLFSSWNHVMADQPTYPQPNLLVGPTELAKPEFANKFVILDARDRTKYEQSHIPNARWVDAATWAKAFGNGDDAKGWSQRIAELGTGKNSKIVVYDDSMSKDAARIWWILRYWGLNDVRLLNGGWASWTKNSLPVQKESPPSPTLTNFEAQAVSKRLATKQSLLDSLKKQNLQIVDARSEGEFCGTDRFTNKRAGAIPGAKHLEWSDLLDKDTQRFKSADELRRLFKDVGIDLYEPIATHCQSGGRASVMAFGLELMGAKDVRNYYKSWAEWGNADDTPIVAGEGKK
jgi:thiosulfate/3-mercaptopyruvate sulfurtransferase